MNIVGIEALQRNREQSQRLYWTQRNQITYVVDRQPIVRARTEMKKAKDDKKPRKRVVQAEDRKQYKRKD